MWTLAWVTQNHFNCIRSSAHNGFFFSDKVTRQQQLQQQQYIIFTFSTIFLHWSSVHNRCFTDICYLYLLMQSFFSFPWTLFVFFVFVSLTKWKITNGKLYFILSKIAIEFYQTTCSQININKCSCPDLINKV